MRQIPRLRRNRLQGLASGTEFATSGKTNPPELSMNAARSLVSLAFAIFAGVAQAQAPATDADSPRVPGARDGSRPSDGAIVGGSILPGESGGMPNDTKVPGNSDRAVSRCNDLNGTLREQCLAQEQGASTGGTRVPDPDIAKPAPTREAPPPQNPRAQ
jgi:hypothetical protein